MGILTASSTLLTAAVSSSSFSSFSSLALSAPLGHVGKLWTALPLVQASSSWRLCPAPAASWGCGRAGCLGCKQTLTEFHCKQQLLASNKEAPAVASVWAEPCSCWAPSPQALSLGGGWQQGLYPGCSTNPAARDTAESWQLLCPWGAGGAHGAEGMHTCPCTLGWGQGPPGRACSADDAASWDVVPVSIG